VIGRAVEEGAEPPPGGDAMRGVRRWPVTLSYFAEKREDAPLYTLTFEMYENGVTGALTLDYGSFALKGAVRQLEVLPASACGR
jgi:hypothetical protein